METIRHHTREELRNDRNTEDARRDAADVLRGFVEEMQVSGFVADALRRHRIEGVSVAPAAAAPE